MCVCVFIHTGAGIDAEELGLGNPNMHASHIYIHTNIHAYIHTYTFIWKLRFYRVKAVRYTYMYRHEYVFAALV